MKTFGMHFILIDYPKTLTMWLREERSLDLRGYLTFRKTLREKQTFAWSSPLFGELENRVDRRGDLVTPRSMEARLEISPGTFT
jgi:hypothetical protein